MRMILQKLQMTQGRWGVSLLRLVIGLIFVKAGSGKLFGWFGGLGIEGVISFFKNLGLPFPLFQAYLVGSTELLGGLAMALGLFTRLAAIPLSVIMIVAIVTVHLEKGDFYYPLVILMSCVALLDVGGGSLSVDRCLSGKCRKEQ